MLALLAAFAANAGPIDVDLVADPGGPYTVDAEGSVVLDGSGSVTFACARAEFGWDLDGDYEVDLDAGTSPTAVFEATGVDGREVRRLSLFVTCFLSDGVTSAEARGSTTLEIRNVDPEITAVTGPASVDEGGTATLELRWTDVEAADTHLVSWLVDGAAAGTEATLELPCPQDGEVEVQARVRDDDGGEDTATLVLVVTNLPPAIVGEPAVEARVGVPWRFAPAVEDPGVQDTHRWSAVLPPGAAVDADSGVVTWTPAAGQEGPWDLALTVQDEDGASDTLLWSIEVTGDEPVEPEPRDPGRSWGEDTGEEYTIAGEGCACGAGTPAPWVLGALPLLALRRRARRR